MKAIVNFQGNQNVSFGTRRFSSFLAISLLALFSGCSEDSSTEKVTEVIQSGMEIVEEVADLPECSAANEGELVYVKAESAMRACSDGKWFSVSEGSSEATTCTTAPLADSSGVKILCGGDSVGVVLNGVDGADGAECSAVPLKDNSGIKVLCGGDSVGVVMNGTDGENGQDGEDCAITTTKENVSITCGTNSVNLKLDSLGNLTGVEESVLDSEKVAISLDTVTGYTQKGPFLSGSKVLVKEMEDGRTLTQTGNTFDGKILNDNGQFRINARMLVSQYVMLEATGYYRNEVTGGNSNSTLTLFAITDVTSRNIVNINLLTHLEYERVIYLVTKKKMTVKKAKRQAQQEIFALLGIDAEGFSNSEDLNIAGSSDEDGALLAFSILFQGDRDVADLTQLLTEISTDMEEDGTWDNIETRIALADWAADADSAGRLATIRTNVENWKLSAMVANFEQYIRSFWYNEYGLGECDATREGEVVASTAGKYKETKTRFVCKESLWQFATDLEKDTYQWESSTDGALRYGSVNTDTYYVYDSLGIIAEGWRKADVMESQHGGCRAELYEEIRKDDLHSAYYRCDTETHLWQLETRYLIIDTQKWPKGTDGDVKWGDTVTTNCYTYDDANAGWREGHEGDCTLGLMGCTVARLGEMRQSATDSEYYSCTSELTWTRVTDDVLLNTDGYICTEGAYVTGKLATSSHFVCDGGKWRAASTQEELFGLPCLARPDTTYNKDSTYACSESNWRLATPYDFRVGARNYFNPDLEYGTLTDARDGRTYKTIQIGNQVWMAENLNYADSTVNGSYYLRGNNVCYKNDSTNCLKAGRHYTWTAAMNIDAKWQNANTPEGLIQPIHQGICPEGWHLPNNEDLNELLGNIGEDASVWQAVGFGSGDWLNATNLSGFSVLPAGYSEGSGSFNVAGEGAYFWSATETGESHARELYLLYSREDADLSIRNKDHASSVRCLKDSQ